MNTHGKAQIHVCPEGFLSAVESDNEDDLDSQASDVRSRDAAGPREDWCPNPSLQPRVRPSIRGPFRQYIFSSLVHNGNLNKRFELQSRLTQHIL